MRIGIKLVREGMFVVEYDLDNGYTSIAGRTATEDEARAMVTGFREGMNAVRAMIGNGATFSNKVETV